MDSAHAPSYARRPSSLPRRMVAPCRCDGPRALRWVHDAFGDCVVTRAAAASLAFGVAALACAFAAQAPQIAKNCRLNSAAALSPGLLVRCCAARCCASGNCAW